MTDRVLRRINAPASPYHNSIVEVEMDPQQQMITPNINGGWDEAFACRVVFGPPASDPLYVRATHLEEI